MSEQATQRRGRRPAQPWWRRHQRGAPDLVPRWPAKPGLMSDAVAASRRVYDERHVAFHELLRRRRGRKTKAANTERPYSVTRKRSDRSEAHARALAFLVGHCDLRTLQAGRYCQGGAIAFYDLDGLARGIGISPYQLDRVLSDFRAAGWIYRHQERELVVEHNTERWSGHVAITKLTLAALAACGMPPARRDVILGREAEAEARAREKAARKRAASEPVVAGTLVSTAIDPALADVRQGVPELRDADRLAYSEIALALRQQYPDWSASRIEWEARKRLYGPPPDRQR